jgi:hypothetical protein
MNILKNMKNKIDTSSLTIEITDKGENYLTLKPISASEIQLSQSAFFGNLLEKVYIDQVESAKDNGATAEEIANIVKLDASTPEGQKHANELLGLPGDLGTQLRCFYLANFYKLEGDTEFGYYEDAVDCLKDRFEEVKDLKVTGHNGKKTLAFEDFSAFIITLHTSCLESYINLINSIVKKKSTK